MSIKLFTKNLKLCLVVDLDSNQVIKTFVHKRTKDIGVTFKNLPLVDIKSVGSLK